MSLDLHEAQILIVDDYKEMLQILRKLLAQVGFMNVDEATDGRMALSLIHSKKYDLIISDWDMKPMNGIELLKTLRAGMANTVPFILVTAEGRPEYVIEARRAGVSSYIIKPFNAAVLEGKITRVLDSVPKKAALAGY